MADIFKYINGQQSNQNYGEAPSIFPNMFNQDPNSNPVSNLFPQMDLGYSNGLPTTTNGGFLNGLKDILGSDAIGNLSTGIQGAGSLASLWMNMKNFGLQKDQLKENKRQYNQNYGAQRQTTNTALRDRQEARVASGGNYQSVGDYMAQNGVR